MKFLLASVLALAVKAQDINSSGEFEYVLEIELKNLTQYALENQDDWTQEHLDQIKGELESTQAF